MKIIALEAENLKRLTAEQGAEIASWLGIPKPIDVDAIKVLLICDASLLDEDDKKVLEEMTETNDNYQILISDRTALDEWEKIKIAAKAPNDLIKDLPLKKAEGETHKCKIRNPLPRNIWRRALD